MQKLAPGVAPQSLSQVHALTFRRYMYDHQVEEAECPLCGANDQCTSSTCSTRSRQRHCLNCHMWLHYDLESLKHKEKKNKLFYENSDTLVGPTVGNWNNLYLDWLYSAWGGGGVLSMQRVSSERYWGIFSVIQLIYSVLLK